MYLHTSTFFSALVASVTGLLLLGSPLSVQAGCGCDKPPPAPATIIPTAAYAGMRVTLFNNNLQAGQTWTVTFQSGGKTTSTKATVATKRSLTDPTGLTYQPQLVVTVPNGVPMGPTQITASKKGGGSFTVPATSFTTIGAPLPMAEGGFSYNVQNYTTGVGADGVLYMALAIMKWGFATTDESRFGSNEFNDLAVYFHSRRHGEGMSPERVQNRP